MNAPVASDDPRSIIMIGAGDHARVLLDLLRQVSPSDVQMITDNNVELHGQRIGDVEIAGGDELVMRHEPDQVVLVNAVGSVRQPTTRAKVFNRFKGLGFDFLTLIHPSAVVAGDAVIGEGAQIMAGVVIQTAARIGRDALLNSSCSIDHDCSIGDHAHIAPGVTLSGSVVVGPSAHLGTGASVIQAVHIGEGALVAAGAVVIDDVSADTVVMGMPARPKAAALTSGTRRHRLAQDRRFNIMLSAAGRRVALLKLLHASLNSLNLEGRILATEINRASSAFHAADVGRVVPNYADPSCLEQLVELCREHAIRLIVPTIDPDLPFYASHREDFLEAGTEICVSDLRTVEICNDKVKTHTWLREQGFPTVDQTRARDLLNDMRNWTFPIFVKPRDGSSSLGAGIVHDYRELEFAVAQRDCIAQTVASGNEYTVDVYVDRQGKCLCEVPRLRIETRAGEVSKGATVRNEAIQRMARQVAEALPGAWGVMNIQIFFDHKSGQLNVSEINPRFGGGYPLSHQAGADMIKALIEEVRGEQPDLNNSMWKSGLMMLRWDDAIFVPSDRVDLASELPQLADVTTGTSP